MHNTNLLHLCLTKRVFESSNWKGLSFNSAYHRFKTTQKGRRFLEIYNKMSNVMEEE
jgi:predicted transcriptional regulator